MNRDTSFLNGIRAFAAFWVVTGHCFIWGGSWLEMSVPAPKIAVDLFMVLSGLLMAYTVQARETTEPMSNPANWLRFYVRRYFRLAPAYYLCLFLVVALAPIYLGGYTHLRELNPSLWQGDWVYDPARTNYTIGNLLLHISFLFGLFPTYSFSTFLPDWSLSLEMQFYVVFPFIYLAMKRFGTGKTAIALALFSYAFMWLFDQAVAAGKANFFFEPSMLFFKLPIFVAGILIYRAASISNSSKWHRAAYVLLALLMCTKLGDIYRYQVLYLTALVALIAIMLVPYRPVARYLTVLETVCRSRVVTFMSDVSYSVYLFHGLFLAIVGSRIGMAAKGSGWSLISGTLAIWLIVILLTYTFSYLVYRFVELPGIALGKTIAGRIGSTNAAEAKVSQ
ncbi:acyltransferase [Pseudomonas sp. MYb2]|jgi:peptidoglycan/LPS O-acetylase OafA/YrhL|uniref:acyltransferase family protein n=1 Tax=Pseudomonas TaxID=286 RepID=UPI000CFE6939|nr:MULTISPECIES: acyltransferase [Pseudomonas]MCP1488008.1 peptidoglycan/LPS O-acetylase OafA/YrhL [Pseudomonas fluorescens]PRB51150.1 acyltransferase [Pseudomonas sp. MYb3]PRC34529.1 acyltransferase [Pseudomonas sp. MYb2]